MNKRMKKFIIIIFMMSAITVSAQSSETVYVTCLLEYETIASDREILTDEYNCFTDFINTFEAKLNANGFELIKQDDYQLSTDLDIVAEMAARSQLLYYLMPNGDKYLHPSNLLNKHITNLTHLYLNDTFYYSLGDHSFNIDNEIIDMALALIFYEHNRCDLAIPYFESVAEQIDRQSDSSDNMHMAIRFYKGNCAILENDIEQAIIDYELGLNISNDQWGKVELAANLAWAYIQEGNNERAFALFDQLWEEINDKEYPYQKAVITFFQSRAKLYALVFDYTAAILDIDTAIEEAKSYSLDKKSLSLLYKQRGDIIMLIYEWNRALEDYNTAIELDPDYAESYYRRGILLYTMVEREDAIIDFERYLELDPEGQFAESATEYIDNIQTELDALGG